MLPNKMITILFLYISGIGVEATCHSDFAYQYKWGNRFCIIMEIEKMEEFE